MVLVTHISAPHGTSNSHITTTWCQVQSYNFVQTNAIYKGFVFNFSSAIISFSSFTANFTLDLESLINFLPTTGTHSVEYSLRGRLKGCGVMLPTQCFNI